jgi:predicted O-linked N-acetylglucosamine transferase (SPINDLY family)
LREGRGMDITIHSTSYKRKRQCGMASSSDPEAAFLAAQALAARGLHAEAASALLALRARLPATTAMLEVHIAHAHAHGGELDAALEAARRAVALSPGMAEAQSVLAAMLVAAGEPASARAALRGALGPGGDARLWLQLAEIEISLGDRDGAAHALQGAERAAPGDALAWQRMGRMYTALQRLDDADRVLAHACALDPGDARSHALLAQARQELGDTAGALRTLAPALQRHPGDLALAASERLMLPQVYASREDVREWRERYRGGLASLAAELDRWRASPSAVFELERNNFLLAYQGEDDLEPQRAYSDLLGSLAGAVHPEWRERNAPTFDGSRRLRVGFVASVFRDTSAGRYFERWVTTLDRERFEIHVYATPHAPDALTARIRDAADRFVMLPAHGEQAAGLVAGDALDLVVHPEVGMHDMSYLLAALRLAPVQVAGWGHPVTTGSAAIDGFVTCAAMEPPDGDAHYVERLIRLPGPGVDYPRPVPAAHATRVELGLPEGRLYACPQSLFKLHPEMDALIADIVQADPGSTVLFFHSDARLVSEQFAQRLGRAFADRGIAPRNQVKILPRMERGKFRQVLALSDVVLDPVRWSGGLTSLDAFAAVVPVVTLPGRFMRGRQTAGMLSLMGIEGLTAASPEQYVRIALDVARDRDLNAALREAIGARSDALYDRREPVAALSEALLRVAAGHAPR